MQDTNGPVFTQTASLLLIALVVNLLLVVGAAGLAWFGGGGDVSTRLAACLARRGWCSVGRRFTALFFRREGLYFIIPGRYGLSLLPVAAACLAVAASRRRYGGPALVLLGVLGLVAFVAACL